MWLTVWLVLLACGCGTTRVSDTQRTATEQLLLSDAIDRAVDRLDFHFLDGQKVYLDASALKSEADAAYLAGSLRQQMAAHGCLLEDKLRDSDYVVEARSGAIGTDHEEVLVGVPATTVPQVGPMTAGPATIPEVPLIKRTEQRGVAKIALFAYNRRTGHAVWQSGFIPTESRVKDLWVLGAGPFQRGQIVDGMHVAEGDTRKSAPGSGKPSDSPPGWLSVGDQAFFSEPRHVAPRGRFQAAGEEDRNVAGEVPRDPGRGRRGSSQPQRAGGKARRRALFQLRRFLATARGRVHQCAVVVLADRDVHVRHEQAVASPEQRG